MNPFAVFDGQKVLPNRFTLALAAAARSRALRRGSRPRLDRPAASEADLALAEIAEGAFTPRELAPFTAAAGETGLGELPGPQTQASRQPVRSAAAAPRLPPEAAH